MTEVTKHEPGRFCWPELGTTDQDGAKRFYSALFGWTTNDQPIGPEAVYTMLQKSGKDVGSDHPAQAASLSREDRRSLSAVA